MNSFFTRYLTDLKPLVTGSLRPHLATLYRSC